MPTAANIYYKKMNLKKLGILILSLVTLFFCLGAEGRGDDFEYVKSHLMGLAAAEGRQLPSEWNSYPDGYEAALRTALDNLALTYIGENWMGPEPPGLNRTIGAYTAACVYYELLFGAAPIGDGYIPKHMEYDAARMEIARLCAHAACLTPGTVTDVGQNFFPCLRERCSAERLLARKIFISNCYIAIAKPWTDWLYGKNTRSISMAAVSTISAFWSILHSRLAVLSRLFSESISSETGPCRKIPVS